MSLRYIGRKCPPLNELKEMKIEIKRETSEVFLAPLTLEKFSAMMQKIKYNSGQ